MSVLDFIAKERAKAYAQHFKPRLRIVLNRFDASDIAMDHGLIPRWALIDPPTAMTMMPTLFGEELIISDDQPRGQPLVEIVDVNP